MEREHSNAQRIKNFFFPCEFSWALATREYMSLKGGSYTKKKRT
jgi:hypothetical protein